jgi:N-acetylmuramoyl-L-alanine amidase
MSFAGYRLGDSGPAVAEARERLARIGLLTDATGPDFDHAVDTAVRGFQQERGLTVDGIIGPATFQLLEEARWRLGDRVLTYSVAHLTTGDDVAELQSRLHELGFSCGRIDGIFGRETDRGVREFQRNVGYTADGTCGPDTFKALARLARTVAGATGDALRDEVSLARLRTGVADKVVVIDPGHGGDDLGQTGNGLAEAEVAADVAAKVEGRLAAIGTQVLLTRSVITVNGAGAPIARADESDRADFANEVGADLVVSIHLDAAVSGSPNGCATFYYGADRFGGGSVLGAQFAQLVQDEIIARTDLVDCGTHPKTWDLLRRTRMPAVRLECGYVSNTGDAARLSDSGFRGVVADSVAAAVVAFFAPRD